MFISFRLRNDFCIFVVDVLRDLDSVGSQKSEYPIWHPVSVWASIGPTSNSVCRHFTGKIIAPKSFLTAQVSTDILCSLYSHDKSVCYLPVGETKAEYITSRCVNRKLLNQHKTTGRLLIRVHSWSLSG